MPSLYFLWLCACEPCSVPESFPITRGKEDSCLLFCNYFNTMWIFYSLMLILNVVCVYWNVQVAVGRRLGVEEPQLVKIMRATLYTHNEWFKLQMCKDRFEGLLRINSLKEVNTSFLTPMSTSKSYTDSCANGSSQATVSSGTRMSEDGNSPTQVSSRDVICDEGAILKVMVSLAVKSFFSFASKI